jgi:hypothetical protein
MEKINKIDHYEDLMPELLRIRPWLLKALEYNKDENEQDVIAALEQRRIYLFTSANAFAMVSFHITDDGRKFVCYRYAGGEHNNSLETILKHQFITEQFALKHDYPNMVVVGRKGWKPFLSAHGYSCEPYEGDAKKYVFIKNLKNKNNNEVTNGFNPEADNTGS